MFLSNFLKNKKQNENKEIFSQNFVSVDNGLLVRLLEMYGRAVNEVLGTLVSLTFYFKPF